MLNIYISTANQYIHLVQPFSYLFNKFWSSDIKVIILGYDYPKFKLLNNFEFISMGKQEGGVKSWSTDLKKFFSSINDEYFIYTVEDHFIVDYVNMKVLNHLLLYTKKDMVGRIGLTTDNKNRSFDIIERLDDYDIIENWQNTEYRLSLLWCIWNKNYFLKYLEDNYSPHDYEIIGSQRALNDGWKIISSYREYAIHQTQAVRKGNLTAPLNFHYINDPRYLDTNIINEMKIKEII